MTTISNKEVRQLMVGAVGEDHNAELSEPEGLVAESSQLSVSAPLELLCRSIGEILVKAYPGWLWAVHPQEKGGMVNIRNMHLHGAYGYRLKIGEIQNDPIVLSKTVVRAAGEVLERFGMPRGPFNADRFAQAKRDPFGNCIPDLNDKRGLLLKDRILQDQLNGYADVFYNDKGEAVFVKKES